LLINLDAFGELNRMETAPMGTKRPSAGGWGRGSSSRNPFDLGGKRNDLACGSLAAWHFRYKPSSACGRDLADLHLKAMTNPEAGGQRFIAVAGSAVSMGEVAKILRARLGDAARKVPRFDGPDWFFRLAAKVMPQFKGMVPQLGIVRNASNAKAKRMLHWSPRPTEEVIVATAESLLAFGLVKNKR